jgi:hypothetical protein
MTTKKKIKQDRVETYGRKDVLDENDKGSNPFRNLWSAVILQAMSNIHFGVRHWDEDLQFIAGSENWNWICEQLGIDAKRTSKLALRAAFEYKDHSKKH